MTSETWERVHTVNDYYDGPRRGVADLCGKPHIYQAEFSDQLGNYTKLFWLREIDTHLLSLVLEDWAIWLRGEEAHKQGRATVESHPALPEERARHDEVSLLIGDQFTAGPDNSVVKLASFRRNALNDLEVLWIDP